MKTLSVPEISSSKKLSDEVTQSSEASEEESDEDMKEVIDSKQIQLLVQVLICSQVLIQ
jgi:hypothetical protein